MKQQYPQFENETAPYPHGICEHCAANEMQLHEDANLKRVYCSHNQAGALQYQIDGDLVWTILTPMSGPRISAQSLVCQQLIWWYYPSGFCRFEIADISRR